MKRKHKRIVGFLALVIVVAAIAVLLRLPLSRVWVAPVHVAAIPLPVLPPEQLPVAPTPAPTPEQRPRIAIVIDDMGLDSAESARAIALPGAVTLSFLPYAPHLWDQTDRARGAGHELLLHIPMEPLGHENPGPGALLTGLSAEELSKRLEKAFASFSGYDGVNNHMGSKFTADSEGMTLVMAALQARGLFFLDSRTGAKSVGFAVAQEHHLPAGARDVFLDDDPAYAAIKEQLAETERVARQKGTAIAIGHPHPASLQALEEWIPGVASRGFDMVPVREIVFSGPERK